MYIDLIYINIYISTFLVNDLHMYDDKILIFLYLVI